MASTAAGAPTAADSSGEGQSMGSGGGGGGVSNAVQDFSGDNNQTEGTHGGGGNARYLFRLEGRTIDVAEITTTVDLSVDKALRDNI